MHIYPKSEKEYIRETIYLKNSSFSTRRAVIEQIISKLTRTEIQNLLIEMEKYQNSLEGSYKSEYEIYSMETKELLENLLN